MAGRRPLLTNRAVTTPGWTGHSIGSTEDWADRAELADIDGDERLDLVVSDENGEADGAGTYWFQAPDDPTDEWERRDVAIQGSTNAMSVLDSQGRVAIVSIAFDEPENLHLWVRRQR